jgi:hypothetical protein
MYICEIPIACDELTIVVLLYRAATLLESELSWDGSEVGSATGSIAVSISDISGDVDGYLSALNPSGVEQLFYNSSLGWSSSSSWSSAGEVTASSVIRVVDPYYDDSMTDDESAAEYNITSYFDCFYEASRTSSATENYAECDIFACPGESIGISLCYGGGSCSGDTYIRLYDGMYEIAQNDDYCGSCSQISRYNVGGSSCRNFTLREGCYSDFNCSGYPKIYISSPIVPESSNTSESSDITYYYVDRDLSLSFGYGDNKYAYVTSVEDSNQYEKFYVEASGGYGGEKASW